MKITDACDYFRTEQQLRGNSEKTLDNYRLILGSFAEYLLSCGIELTEGLTPVHINKYQLYLKDRQNYNSGGKKLTQRSIQTYMRHIKVFVAFCCREDILPESVYRKVILPKAEKPVIKVLTDFEVNALLSSFNLRTEFGLRDYAICALMLDCGLRAGEICNLKVQDLNFESGFVIVTGKGNKSRVVPIGFKCRKAVSTYLYKRRINSEADNDYLFLTKQRQPLNVYSITRIFKKIKKRAGIPRVHAHLLRHTFATNFLMGGIGDVYELCQVLGHSDIHTTQLYLHTASYYSIAKKKRKNTYLDMMG